MNIISLKYHRTMLLSVIQFVVSKEFLLSPGVFEIMIING